MRTKYLFGIMLLSLLTISFSACSDDYMPLSFDQDSYEVPAQGSRYLGLQSGNGEYTLEIKDPQIATASIEHGWSNPGGSMISVYGMQKGETTLTITDNATKETRSLQIRVTDGYEIYHIYNYESNHPALKETPFIFLIANEARDVYFFSQKKTRVSKDDLLLNAKGRYAFTQEDNNLYLTLTYSSDDNGRLTDATIAPTPHKFLITESSEVVLHRLDKNLNLGLRTPSLRTSPNPYYYKMNIQEVGTEYKISGSLEYGQIPDGILK